MKIVMRPDETELLDRAINMHGINYTGDEVIESCVRLITALYQYSRSEIHKESLAEHMAQVHVRLMQLSRFTGEESVHRAMRLKLADIRERLEYLTALLEEQRDKIA